MKIAANSQIAKKKMANETNKGRLWFLPSGHVYLALVTYVLKPAATGRKQTATPKRLGQ